MCIVGKYFYFPHPQPSVWRKTIHCNGLGNRMDMEKAAAISLSTSPPPPASLSFLKKKKTKRTIKKNLLLQQLNLLHPSSPGEISFQILPRPQDRFHFLYSWLPRHLEPCQLKRTCSGEDWLIPRDSKCCSWQHTSDGRPFILESASLPSHL